MKRGAMIFAIMILGAITTVTWGSPAPASESIYGAIPRAGRYGRRMATEITHPSFGYRLSYRRMIDCMRV